jgi:hypothetical protein
MNPWSLTAYTTWRVNKIMRLIFHKINYSIIRINQHCPLQNNIPLTGSQLLLGSWWRRLQPSGRCQVFESDSPRLSILIWEQVKITRWQIWRMRSLQKHGNALLRRTFTNWQCCVRGRVVMMKLEGSSRRKFPFQPASPSFSDCPGLQDNILILCHQMVQILYELPRGGRAIAQAVSRWLPTAAARVRARVWSSGICGEQSGAGASFLRVLRFPLPIFIPPNSPSS